MTDETTGQTGDPVDPLEGPTTPRPGSTDPDNEVVPAERAEPVAAAPDPDPEGGESGAATEPTSAGERIRRSAERLDELASELRDPEVSDSRAAELAREAAELVGTAAGEVDRALRAAGETD